MAQGEFTKPECDNAEECIKTILDALPKSKKMNLIGEFNDLFLFVAAAKKAAPDEAKPKG